MAEELVFHSKEEMIAFLNTVDDLRLVKITVEETREEPEAEREEGSTDG